MVKLNVTFLIIIFENTFRKGRTKIMFVDLCGTLQQLTAGSGDFWVLLGVLFDCGSWP